MNYEDAIGIALINLQIHEIFEIETKVKPDNRTKFIFIVKQYIDKNFGNNEGWQVIFNNNYSKVRKDRFA